MKFALRCGLAIAVASSALMAAPAPVRTGVMTWPDLLGRKHPTPTATVTYGADPLQVVDVWVPRGRGLHPVVLMIHGGCWQSDIADRRIMDWIANDLRRRGIAVWNVDYRGVDRPGGGFPGTFNDVAAAADALRQNARKYRLDTARWWRSVTPPAAISRCGWRHGRASPREARCVRCDHCRSPRSSASAAYPTSNSKVALKTVAGPRCRSS